VNLEFFGEEARIMRQRKFLVQRDDIVAFSKPSVLE
jgi:hypothetical protein